MAQDKFQPIVSDVKADPYIRSGTVDGSAGIMANTVANLIPGAIKGYEGYQHMLRREAQDENIAQLEQTWAAEEADSRIPADVSAVDNIWDNTFDSGLGTKMDSVNILEKDIQKQIGILKAAKDQGRITDEEFLARNTKIIRSFVNKNPWMEGEIYSAAQTHLEALGITDTLTQRAKVAKAGADAAEATMKFYREGFKDAKILDKWDPNAGEAVWQQQLQETQQRAYRLQFGRDVLEWGKISDQRQMQQVLDGEGMKFHFEDVADFQTTLATKLEASTSPKDYDNAIAAAKLEAEKRVRQYRQSLGSAALTQEGKDLIAQVEKDYNGIVTTLIEAGDGKRGAERLRNTLEITKANQSLQVREKYNPEMIDIATKVIGSLGDSSKIELRKLGLPSYESAVKTVIDLLDPKNAGEKTTTGLIKSGQANAAFQGVLQHQAGWSTRENQTALTQFTSTVNQAIANGSIKPQEGTTAVHGLLKSVAQNTDKFQGQPVNPEFSRQVNTAVSTAMKDAVPSLMTAINEVMTNPANRGAKPPELDVLPNGSFVIKTGNPTADEKFNRAFSNKVNNALDAYAAANGMTREKAAPQFYNDYLRIYVAMDKDLEALEAANPIEPSSSSRSSTPSETPSTNMQGDYTQSSIQPSQNNQVPLSGKEVRDASKDLRKRYEQVKRDFKAKKISFEDYDKRINALLEEGARLAEMNRD